MSHAPTETTRRPADPDHIADVLHDLVGHHLVLLTAQTRIWQEKGHSCSGADLTLVTEIAESALRNLRRASSLLHSSDVERPSPYGIAHWIKGLPGRIPREVADVSTTVNGPDLTDISPIQELLLERVVMEGVTNAAQHRTGGRLSIRCAFGDEIVVTIVSFGAPERPVLDDLHRGHGLRGLALDVTRCGGRLTTRRKSAKRFTIEVSLPR